MTKGDRDKLRAELAGKAMQGLLSNPNVVGGNYRCGWVLVNCEPWQLAEFAIELGDAAMERLGLSLDKEDHPAYDPS